MTPLLLLLQLRQRRRFTIILPSMYTSAVVVVALLFLSLCCCNNNICEAFVGAGVVIGAGVGVGFDSKTITTGMMTTTTTTMMMMTSKNNSRRRRRGRGGESSSTTSLNNLYDDWKSDAVVDQMHLDEDNVIDCLDEFIDSDYGTTMFGCHDRASSIGITGYIEFVELCGPTVTLTLPNDCKFWHKRSFVLGRAAVYLNARIPEITDVIVDDLEELNDYKEIIDELSGEVLYKKDKKSNDFNGDRQTMEYQGYVTT
jgi:hypothetical protein